MFKEIGQLASLMKQAQGMQGKIAESKERVANLKCEGEAGGGMVSVTMGGNMKVVSCKIDASVFETGDREMIEDLVVVATNQALEKLIELQSKEMSAIAGGLNLPGLNDAMSGFGFGK